MTAGVPTVAPAAASTVTPGPRQSDRWRRPSPIEAVALGSLAVPFAAILLRFAATADHGIFLPDDLALIDLHTRTALHWQQALGPFDRFGWNHPGPVYYYLLSIPYRILGAGPSAAFFGATLINALAALGVVWVCRRRGGPLCALWAAVCVGALELVLSINSAPAVTYSEGALGAAVSPWTATVIVLPLLLFAVLCAAAATGSPLSALGALLLGSFVVQTDLSAAPLVLVLFLLGLAAGAVTYLARRRSVPGAVRGAGGDDDGPTRPGHRPRRQLVLAALGIGVFLAIWIPPLIQNLATHPGNLDLIYRFFTSPHPGHPFSHALWAVVATDAVAVFGPDEIMHKAQGAVPAHVAIALGVLVAFVLLGAAAVARGWQGRDRFAVALGAFSLVGLVTTVVAVARITGRIWGYLILWEITVPTLALLGLGAALFSSPADGRRRRRLPPAWTARALGALALVIGLALCVRLVALPPLSSVSDPKVGAVVALVTPALPRSSGPVFVGDAGLGLVETEEFIGVVNRLDLLGYRPKVNKFWITEFGPGYVSSGHIRWYVALAPWSPSAPGLTGYVGRVGGIAVTVSTMAPPPL